MKKLLLLLITAGIHFSYAQDTVYLDKAQKITTKENAEFIRVTVNHGDLYRSETRYLSTNKICSVLNYRDQNLSVLEGAAEYYYANGNPDSKGTYKNNKRDGTWSFYFSSGQLSGKVFFRNGKVATSEYLEEHGHMMDQIEDVYPTFKGGKEALISYIRKNFKSLSSSPDGKERIRGTMKVGFVVTETGKVTNVHIVSGINEEVDQKAVKMISAMPDWRPGMQMDTPVSVPLIIPIIF